MMTYISEFLIAAFTAAILQNAVFARGLGASGETLALNKPRGDSAVRRVCDIYCNAVRGAGVAA